MENLDKKEWLKDKVIYYELCDSPAGCACDSSCKYARGWKYKKDYNKFVEENKTHPKTGWNRMPFTVTKDETTFLEIVRGVITPLL